MRVLLAIKEAGSITGGARLLGASQPAVSQHLQRAEARLGVPLVIRMGRQVRLSEAGAIIARAAPGVLDAIAAAQAELAHLADLKSGTVHLASFATASSTLVPAILRELRGAAPDLTVSTVETEPKEAIRLVLEGVANVALVPSYVDEPLDVGWLSSQGVAAIPRFIDEMLLVLPQDHPLAEVDVVDLAELEDDEWVAGCPRCLHHVIHACRHEGFEPTIAFTNDNFGAVVGLVAAGMGVTILPRLALASTMVPAGAVVRQTNPRGSREIFMLVPRDLVGSHTVSAVLSAITRISGSAWELESATG